MKYQIVFSLTQHHNFSETNLLIVGGKPGLPGASVIAVENKNGCSNGRDQRKFVKSLTETKTRGIEDGCNMETIKGVKSLNVQTEQGKTTKEDTVDELIERGSLSTCIGGIRFK